MLNDGVLIVHVFAKVGIAGGVKDLHIHMHIIDRSSCSNTGGIGAAIARGLHARGAVVGLSGTRVESLEALAAELGAVYLDGDDLHSAANITKMSAGEPLSDADRAPWLRGIGQALAAADGMLIVGCSALRRTYRDWILQHAKCDVGFLHLSGSRAVIEQRMSIREGHFMPVKLLDSQFATLEPLHADETAVVVDIDQKFEAVVAQLANYIRNRR